jgi:hypothetical protein
MSRGWGLDNRTLITVSCGTVQIQTKIGPIGALIFLFNSSLVWKFHVEQFYPSSHPRLRSITQYLSFISKFHLEHFKFKTKIVPIGALIFSLTSTLVWKFHLEQFKFKRKEFQCWALIFRFNSSLVWKFHVEQFYPSSHPRFRSITQYLSFIPKFHVEQFFTCSHSRLWSIWQYRCFKSKFHVEQFYTSSHSRLRTILQYHCFIPKFHVEHFKFKRKEFQFWH